MKQLNDKNRRGFNGRIDYSRISSSLRMPNLVEIQTSSYEWFLTEGIEQVFTDIFPIESPSKDVVIDYESFHIEEPKYTALECKKRGLTYSGALKVKLNIRVQKRVKLNLPNYLCVTYLL